MAKQARFSTLVGDGLPENTLFSTDVPDVGTVTIVEVLPLPLGQVGVTLLLSLLKTYGHFAGMHFARKLGEMECVDQTCHPEHAPWEDRGKQYILIGWVEREKIRDRGRFISQKVRNTLRTAYEMKLDVLLSNTNSK